MQPMPVSSGDHLSLTKMINKSHAVDGSCAQGPDARHGKGLKG